MPGMIRKYGMAAAVFFLTAAKSGAATDAIRLNQIGFYPDAPKFAVAVGSGSDCFHVTTPDLADTVFTAAAGQAETWTHSGETVRLLDFTDFAIPGEYTLVVPDLGQSHAFRIADHVHQNLVAAAAKNFYFQRASMALDEAFAGIWHRPAGHPDTQVYVHPSAATEARPAGTILSAPRGWYDAGDYNKYIVNSGISTYTLLAAYEHFPAYFDALVLDIPESGNAIPDILDEALWNIRWMLTMQDPDDGGVYHKLTTAVFSGMVMPHQATARRYVVQKSTSAALDFAAVMAQAARIFDAYAAELPGLADSCLSEALQAWNWAARNPGIFYNQNAINDAFYPDINTGTYESWNLTDEFRWAAAELFITTGADSFFTGHHPMTGGFMIPWWGDVSALGLYSLDHYRDQVADAIDTAAVSGALRNLAGYLRDETGHSAYHVVMGQSAGDFVWGSNSVAANQGMVLIRAYVRTGDTSCLEAALQNLDYLAGRNATGYCFVTGAGDNPPMHPHHRPSQADGITDPVPGMMVGGPNPNREDGAQGYIGTERARSYADVMESYASNENAINWNAAMVYLAGALEALYSPTGLPVTTAVPGRPASGQAGPGKFALLSNFPNPFNPVTTILYTLPQDAHVRLELYSLNGRRIGTLQNGDVRAGRHAIVWNAETDTGMRPASGVVVAVIRARFGGEEIVDSRKMLYLK